MSLYGDYLKEQRGDEIIENDNGFASYRFLNEKQVYLIDIYVRPEFRRHNKASDLANMIAEIAKGKGCTEMIGSVMTASRNPTEGMKAFLKYGFKISGATNEVILLKKELV